MSDKVTNDTARKGDSVKQDSAKKKGRRNKIALVICILLIIALIGIIFYLIFFKDNDKEEKRNVVVTSDNVDDVLSKLDGTEPVDSGSYVVTMNSTWIFDNGLAVSENAYVENSTANADNVYFDINRSDTGETIYRSPILTVGSHLEEIALDEELEAGTYNCVMTYYLLDEKEEKKSSVNVSLTIIVNN